MNGIIKDVYDKKAFEYCQKKTKDYPDLVDDIREAYGLYQAEVNDEESPESEYENMVTYIEQLIINYN